MTLIDNEGHPLLASIRPEVLVSTVEFDLINPLIQAGIPMRIQLITDDEAMQTPVMIAERTSSESGKERFAYLRVGRTMFVDRFAHGKINPHLLPLLRNNLVLLDGPNALSQYQLTPYAIACIAALERVSLTGKRVLDAGCADGIMGLLALNRGAESVQGIELREQWRRMNRRLLGNNGIDPTRFEYLAADIRSDEATKAIKAQAPEIVIANIGPEYGDADMHLIETIGDVPKVTTFIGAGYGQLLYTPDRALRALEERGFKVKDVLRYNMVLAFIAERSRMKVSTPTPQSILELLPPARQG